MPWEEKQLFDMHPSLGANLLGNIPKLEEVARIIALQEKHYDGGGFPDDGPKGEEIPVGARILKAVTDTNILLVSKCQEVSKPLLIRLENFAKNFGIGEPLEMLLPLKEKAD